MDQARQPGLDPSSCPVLADEDVKASVPVGSIMTADIPTQNVFLDPVYFEVSKRNAIPHADHRETVLRGKGVGQEIGHVPAPEGRHPWIGQPFLQQRGVVERRNIRL